ncbi:hypothetical protein B0H17DRAFT_1336624 [Mycena rosella]|uniref:Uncharacterized protein n=1 Tax=Mycena rosella TaxID=1033263 RepID=A0AAD7CUT2_MYCRO|nr:hypothetical protein B0H17DRAFT_1336624 [Mycena rosella]
MAPIALRRWVPRNTKPSFDWKARNSEEIRHFDAAFANKEFLQNMTGQILKDLQVREWSGWEREDLAAISTDQRVERKRSLLEAHPGLATGPHGVSIKHDKCLPLYILSANIPIPSKTDFVAVVVLWTIDGHMNGLSFYNNHLDETANFDSFAVDGYSTSKGSPWAVGMKGKGHKGALQHWYEAIEKWAKTVTLPSNLPQVGVSFRVGEQVGEPKWKYSRKAGNPDTLRIILDDLTTRTVSEYLKHRYQQDIDDAPDGGDPPFYDTKMENAKMRDKGALVLKQATKRRIAYGLNAPDGTSLVKADEVCITIIGVNPKLTPEALFSAIYGIIPPPREWRVPGHNVQFFLGNDTKTKFYHRDQFVPRGVRLNKLSINYHGDLSLTSERLMVQNDRKYWQYRSQLCASADMAFRTLPDLAIELALDILTDEHSDALAGIVKPAGKDAAAEYRVAFDAAMRRLSGATPDKVLHPYAKPDENLRLFTELGLTPFKVSYKALDIIHHSGAYLPVQEYARSVLLSAPLAHNVKGLDRLQAALKMVVPDVPADHITVREYDKVHPTAVWDDDHKLFAFASPKPCEEHPDNQCLCWVGPVLQEAARDYNVKNVKIPPRRLFRAYLSCMGGDTIMKTIDSATPMDVDKPSVSQPGVPTPGAPPTRPGSTTQAVPNAPTVSPTKNQAPKPASPQLHRNGNATATVHLPAPQSQQQAPAGSGPGPEQRPVAVAPAQPPAIQLPPESVAAPAQDTDEAALNRAALMRVGKAVLGYDVLQGKHDALANEIEKVRAERLALQCRLEDLYQRIGEKDEKMAGLEEENRELREDLAFYEEGAAARKAKRDSKRQRTE